MRQVSHIIMFEANVALVCGAEGSLAKPMDGALEVVVVLGPMRRHPCADLRMTADDVGGDATDRTNPFR